MSQIQEWDTASVHSHSYGAGRTFEVLVGDERAGGIETVRAPRPAEAVTRAGKPEGGFHDESTGEG